ncbi:hypothetical protein GCM10007216_26480 [Thalassobacillus devorans]|uniref:Uncharacterized protein n=1 Tax=Thalassobacillus devorans TaxID=279813 RepID=A0ABQ1PCF0_9BACI|nr:hypothetical protein [Thalassobacillus devorans]NIK29149.1 hypothetical protein [Thalassobacillus devorans]GGC94453.1 hypothetical protein GCM10007216_26480 [Thalassobacillus devorans]
MEQKNLIAWMFVTVGIMNALTGAIMMFILHDTIISFVFLASSLIFLLAGKVAWTETHGEDAKD